MHHIAPVFLFALLGSPPPIGPGSVVLDMSDESSHLLFGAPPGYEIMEHSYVNITRDHIVPPYTDGHVFKVFGRAGQGFLFYGPVIPVGDGMAHVSCSIYLYPGRASVTLAVLNVPEGGSLEDIDGLMTTRGPDGDAESTGATARSPGWQSLELFYDPPGNAVVPVIQVVTTLAEGSTLAYFDRLAVTNLAGFHDVQLTELLQVTPAEPVEGNAPIPVRWNGNGHYYATMPFRGEWEAASAEAASLHSGGGYFATLTSWDENDFVVSALGWSSLMGRWLGGIQSADVDESDPVNRSVGWQWVSGETWNFTNWARHEPDDYQASADVLAFSSNPDEPGTWDDNKRAQGYVVEWDQCPLSLAADGLTIETDAPSPDLTIAAPPGFSPAPYSFGLVPDATPGSPVDTNELGLQLDVTDTQGLTLYGPPVLTGGAVMIDCVVYAQDEGIALTLAGLEVPAVGGLAGFNGGMSADVLPGVSAIAGRWSRIRLVLKPTTPAIVPVLQIVGISGTPATLFVDRFEITSVDGPCFERSLPIPTLTPVPTIPPTPIPAPATGWASESYIIPNMQGEVRVLLTDVDGDSMQDILIANSASRDFDPSYQVMYGAAPGTFRGAEPLGGRDWVPGLHNDIFSLPGMEPMILDVLPGGAWDVPYPQLRTYRPRDRQYVDVWVPADARHLYGLGLHDDPSQAWARTYPIAFEADPETRSVRCVVSAGKAYDYAPWNYIPPRPPDLSSTLYDLRIAESGEIEETAQLDTKTPMLLDDAEYLVTSIETVSGRVFLLADTIDRTWVSLGLSAWRGTTLLELVDGELIRTPYRWQASAGGHLLALPDGEGDGSRKLIVREGTVLHVLQVEGTQDPYEHWQMGLFQPLTTGGYLLGHTTAETIDTVDENDPQAMTFQGELLPGDFNTDGMLDLLLYDNGIQVVPASGEFTYGNPQHIDLRMTATDACVGDLDGDGDDDIIAVSGNEMRLYFQGEQSSQLPAVLPPAQYGEVTTFAGARVPSPDGDIETVGIEFQDARRIAVDGGVVFVSDAKTGRVYRRGWDCTWSHLTDAGGDELAFSMPTGLFADATGRLLICESGRHRVLDYNLTSKEVSVFAGNGEAGTPGLGGPAAEASLTYPCDIERLPDGRFIIADTGNHAIHAVDPDTGIIQEYLPATAEQELHEPVALAVDRDGAVLVSESSYARVRRFWFADDAWRSEILMGGKYGSNDGPNIGSSLIFPEGIALTPGGDLLVADTGNQRLLRRSENGVSWFAGSGVELYITEGLPLNVFHFRAPTDIAALSNTEFLVADGASVRHLRLGAENPDVIPEPWIPPPTATMMPTATPTVTPIPTSAPGVRGPMRIGAAGHYYAIVESPTAWPDASELAQSLFDGTGHLATMTSSGENQNVVSRFGWESIVGCWLGGFQDPNVVEDEPGQYAIGWSWVTGEPWEFTHWMPDQPLDRDGTQDFLRYDTAPRSYVPGAWINAGPANTAHFVVEWDHDPRAGSEREGLE